MQINRLTVENFRCFDNQSWEFSPRFNVLIGDNGTGKSAVLEALAVALDPAIYKTSVATPRAIRPDDVRLKKNEKQFPVIVNALGTYGTTNLEWERTLSASPNARTTNKGTHALRLVVEKVFEEVRNGQPVTAPVVCYFTTVRLWRQKSEKLEETVSPGSRLRAYDYSLDAESNDSFLFRWLKTRQLATMQLGARTGNFSDPDVEAIQNAISKCMEGSRRYLSFDIKQNAAIVSNKAGDDHVPFRMLSDGQRNIAAMILDIGYRCLTLNPHLGENALLETPGVVLIDEIDLHLHPKWQRQVVGDLREAFPKIQFIATTHSPLIIQSLKAGELIDLGPQVDEEPEKYIGKSPEDILEDVQNVFMPQRSSRSLEMIRVAERYYQLLEQAPGNPDLPQLRRELDLLMEPYEENEAFIAALRLERQASGVDGKAAAKRNGNTH